ncbi:MAG: GvpL/GvpF family gas vesicle protein [Labilithrix sp.]|nr:GvpL/GvpF family gas vesicle protein [Labilithrix sp.]
MSALYLYAIVGEEPARLPRGTEVVRAGRAWVVVARRAAPAVTLENAVAHDRVVQQLARACDAVLPLRFGGTIASEAALRKKLAPLAGPIREALARVRGAVQMTMRVSGQEAAHVDDRPEEGPQKRVRSAPSASREGRVGGGAPDDDQGPGARYLARKVAAERVPEIAPITQATRERVRAARIERKRTERSFATVYHLVDKGELRAWRRIVRATSIEGVTVTVSGPWPPYAFAEL